MKLHLLLALVSVSALSGKLKPIYEFSEWWADRDFDSAQWNQSRSGKIIGGQEATAHQFPYQVALMLFMKGSSEVGLCSGSMISTKRVITAAHCCDIVVGLEAIFGAHYLTHVEKSQVRRTVLLKGLVVHENYNNRDLSNDIAIIFLPTPVKPNDVIQVVHLPQDYSGSRDFIGENAIASGWGRFSSAQVVSKSLRYTEVKVIPNNVCRKNFPTRVRNSTICASGSRNDGQKTGICKSDSGGPLTVMRDGQRILIGIASFVSGVGCEMGIPTGFTRVTSFVPWIQSRL